MKGSLPLESRIHFPPAEKTTAAEVGSPGSRLLAGQPVGIILLGGA
ncbi:hypothetical protein THTE_0675 [Thermogutta terrifontis]|uniref:Uncharacterized protein n=1 Tax=Thermogutta terrifontis TaxID=1331910 RepID=A0A286RBG4_9BACT|nr:hypothetical protein THTE_0675 [Thermogutta terrifontis]